MQTLTGRRLLTSTGTIEFPIITIIPDGLIEDISSDPPRLSQHIKALPCCP